MKTKFRHLFPLSLILLRLSIAFFIVFIVFFLSTKHSILIFILIIIGFLSDFFDGYLARLLDVSSQFLRRFDTLADRIFWLGILFAAWIYFPNFFRSKIIEISIVLGLEGLNYAISFIRFKREIATHAILSKIWAISLLLAFCDLFLYGSSPYLFDISILLGILSRIDTGLIMLILRKWNHDIPSFYHAILLRKGIKIKRNKFFNG